MIQKLIITRRQQNREKHLKFEVEVGQNNFGNRPDLSTFQPLWKNKIEGTPILKLAMVKRL